MPNIQYCEDCKHCIMPSLHPELNMILSRSIEKPKNQFCSVVRTADTCEDYEKKGV